MTVSPVLRYRRTVLATGGACLLLFGGATLSSVLFPDTISGCAGRPVTAREAISVAACLAAFTILGAALVVAFFVERHELSPNGLASRNLLGRRRTIDWNDLQSVSYCPYPRAWFRLKARSGCVIRISFALQGLPAFAEFVLEKAPAAAIDDTSLAVLRAVAAGHEPPMRLA